MPDQSSLDKKYFIDGYVYNCPFCKRGSVSYGVEARLSFDWSENRTVYIYIIRCESCNKQSFHLSDSNFNSSSYQRCFVFGPSDWDEDKSGEFDSTKLDEYFFYHQPTSFFTIDNRIPEKIRDLVSEADQCRKMNLMVGASGALRKAIYEFVKLEKVGGKTYQEKIKVLKVKYPKIDAEYFDALANIQDMTSDQLHEQEGSWEPWSRHDFDYVIETVKEVLNEVYVLPSVRKNSWTKILNLKSKSSFKEKK